MNLKQLTQKHHYIPPPKQRPETTTNENISLCIKVLNVDLPAHLLKDAKESFFIKASLFDGRYKTFFGKQWDSSPLENMKTVNDIIKLDCNQNIYFHTGFLDEYLAVMFEVVQIKSDGKQASAGWGLFNIFKCTKSITDLQSNAKADLISIEIYKGTPRALFKLPESPERHPKIKTHEKSFIHLNLHLHKAFDISFGLIPEYLLVHEDDIIPGFVKDDEGFIDFDNPRLMNYQTYTIEKVEVFIGPSLVDFEKELLEDILSDQISRDGIVSNRDISSMEIVERRLRVGVHNGLMYTEDNDTIYLNVHNANSKRSATKRPSSSTKSTDPNYLTAKNSVEISIPADPDYTIVFILEYNIRENKSLDNNQEKNGLPPSFQHIFQIRWIKYNPFKQGITSELLRAGVRLELDFSGGAIEAPEHALCYKPDSKLRSINQADGDKTAATPTNSKLFAVMREKDPNDKEPMTSVTNASSLINDFSAEENIDKIDTRQLSKAPKPLQRKSKISAPSKQETERHTESQITEAQMRMFQQVLLQQQSQNLQSLKYLSASQPMTPAMIGIPYPNQMVNLWQTKLIGNDKIVDYDSIDAYIVNEQYSATAGGRSGRMYPLQMRAHHGLGLSRATYARMHDAGFPDLLDCNGDQPFVIDPSVDEDGQKINLALEEMDHKQCNEIVFQFMALSRFELNNSNTKTRSVFFTFQFYRFPVISTECLVLDKIIDHLSNYEQSAPMILRKTDESGKMSTAAPGTIVKYSLDPSFMKPGEMFGFLEYLKQQILHIDVWDGDSLMLIGSCAVKLKNLCRQGRTSVQMSYELDIINQMEIDEENVVNICGRLHLRMANLGSVSTNRTSGMTVRPNQKKGIIVDATDIERFSIRSLSQSKLGGSLTDIYRAQDVRDDRLSFTNLVVRPQPAVSKNRELSEMLENRALIKGDISLSPVKTPLMNEDVIRGIDHDKAKKLERFKNALRQLDSANLDVTDTHNKLVLESKLSNKAEKQRALQTIQCYREQQKGETIKKLLNGVIEKEIAIYPRFGCTELFEVKIKNHFNIDTNVNIEISDPSNYLAPILNPNELKALKNLYSISTVSENDLISFNKDKGVHQIFMKSKESVVVPFKYTNMNIVTNPVPLAPSSPGYATQSFKLQSGDVEHQIVFRTAENKLLSILRIRVIPQPPVVDQTFRLFHPEQSFLKTLVRLPPLQVIAGPNDAIQTLSRCTDPEVLTECQPVPIGTPHDILLKIPCGPAPQVREFLMAIFVDKFLLKPIQVWHFSIHSKCRIDVVAHQGKSTNLTLLLKGTSSTHHVQVYTSHPDELCVGSVDGNAFTLAAHTTYELSLSLTPLRIGNRKFQVNVVDVTTRSLVRSWMICAICKEPEISKLFEMQLPAGGGDVCKKRVGFQNPYAHRKKFYLSTDRPDLLILKDSILAINANEVEHIGMVFVPVGFRGKQKIYVFINDEDGMNVETFAIIVSYQ